MEGRITGYEFKKEITEEGLVIVKVTQNAYGSKAALLRLLWRPRLGLPLGISRNLGTSSSSYLLSLPVLNGR